MAVAIPSNAVDDVAFVQGFYSEAFNHDPATLFMNTGAQLSGRPSMGSWFSYGLGSENRDLPAYVVLTSFGSGRPDDQPLYDRLWGAGFLPSVYQGVQCRSKGEPVLYLENPPGIDRELRGEVVLRARGELPNDGKVIEDARSYQ